MLHAAEVALRRVGEETRQLLAGVAGRRYIGMQRLPQTLPVEAEIIGAYPNVGDYGTPAACELADTVHRVVVVVGQEIGAAGAERIGLTHQSQSAGRVGHEDDLVLGLVGIEEAPQRGASLLGQLGRGQRGGVVGVRVAQHALAE